MHFLEIDFAGIESYAFSKYLPLMEENAGKLIVNHKLSVSSDYHGNLKSVAYTSPEWKHPLVCVKILEPADHSLRQALKAFMALFPTAEDIANYITSISYLVLDFIYGKFPDKLISKNSFEFYLREFDGLAHVCGELDKQMHVSLNWIKSLPKPLKLESINGVIIHEMTHIWQNTNGIPVGLVEGFADWVRLMLGYPCWTRTFSLTDTWDAGYSTTGFFLEWIDEHIRSDFCLSLNAALRNEPWSDALFKQLCGYEPEEMWWHYQSFLSKVEIIKPCSRYEMSEIICKHQIYTIRSQKCGKRLGVFNNFVICEMESLLHQSLKSSPSPVEVMNKCLRNGTQGRPLKKDSAHEYLDNLKWTLIPLNPPYFKIQHVATRKIMDVSNNSNENGTRILVYDDNSGKNSSCD